MVSSVRAMPDQPFYVIFKDNSVTIPGDERSRTHPGHGYPEYTEQYVTPEIYTEEKHFVAAVERLKTMNATFKAGTFFPAAVETKVDVQFRKF